MHAGLALSPNSLGGVLVQVSTPTGKERVYGQDGGQDRVAKGLPMSTLEESFHQVK